MDQYRITKRKIDPTQGRRLADGTPNDADRVEIGPTLLAIREWQEAGLAFPNLEAMRSFRLNRLVSLVQERDYGGILLFDPLNIRYATDTTNMQLWNTHNPFRAALICADGYMVVFDYKDTQFLCDFNPLVREVRSGASMFYFIGGDQTKRSAWDFAGQIDDLMGEHAGANRKLAVDKIMVHGLDALRSLGFIIEEGEEVTEKARSVKGPDEIKAMRCAHHGCESAIRRMHEQAAPGMSEDEIWAILHMENIRRGGEWIETRLLTTGPRTNPWFQECGQRRLRPNEILAFDTDMVGAYGMCTDISRTWWIGDDRPRPDMVDAMRHAVEHVEYNKTLLKPGVSFRDLTFNGHKLHDKFQAQKYSCMMHGVGLCDEWPMIYYPDQYVPGAYEYVLEPGMVFCVEVLLGEVGADFSIKLENQVVITETGHETMTTYPYDERLLGKEV